MELAFDTEELRTVCELESQAVTRFGHEVAMSLRHRLADLAAASAVAELPVGNPHLERREGGELLFIDLARQKRLVLVANHRRNPTLGDGSIDWNRVRRLKLIEIRNVDGNVQS